MRKERDPLEIVRRLLGEIRDAWAQMLAAPTTPEPTETLAHAA